MGRDYQVAIQEKHAQLKKKLLRLTDSNTKSFWIEVAILSNICKYFKPAAIFSIVTAAVSFIMRFVETIVENGAANNTINIEFLKNTMLFFIALAVFAAAGYILLVLVYLWYQIANITKGRAGYIFHIIEDYHYCRSGSAREFYPVKHISAASIPEINQNGPVIDLSTSGKEYYDYVRSNAMLGSIWGDSFKEDVPNMKEEDREKTGNRLDLMRRIIDRSLDCHENTPLLYACSSKAEEFQDTRPDDCIYRAYLRRLNGFLFDGVKTHIKRYADAANNHMIFAATQSGPITGAEVMRPREGR